MAAAPPERGTLGKHEEETPSRRSAGPGERTGVLARRLAGAGGTTIFLSYVAVFVALCWPWLGVATEAVPINTTYARGDTRLITWILWWVAHSLVQDPAGILDAPINYPAAHQLTGSEHFAALQIVFLPIYELTGNAVLALNAVLFLSYPLAALAMNRLLVALGLAPLVAWIIGLSFALGSLHAPTSVHMLHTLAFYLPAVALTLHRLRETPDARRGLWYALVLLLGAFTAYYTIAILLVVGALWGMSEALRPLPERRRFVAIVLLATIACLLVLGLFSLPYLGRAEGLVSAAETVRRVRMMAAMSGGFLIEAPVAVFGGVALVLALVGLSGLLDRRLRRLTLTAIALVVTSFLLIRGGALELVASLPPSPLTVALGVPARFFRVLIRYASIAGFGIALLGAVALDLATRRLPRAAAALAVAVLAGVIGERGSQLFLQETETSPAFTSDATVYGDVARITADEGPGALLELPLWSRGYSLQAEAMMGSMQHRLPLISGHTGYLPPHRELVDASVRRLPSEDALQDLVDMTRLRWLLLRPAEYWRSAEWRDAFLQELVSTRGVGPIWTIDGWTLLLVRREPLHGEVFDAIAGARSGATAADVVSAIHAASSSAAPAAGSVVGGGATALSALR